MTYRLCHKHDLCTDIYRETPEVMQQITPNALRQCRNTCFSLENDTLRAS